MNTTKSALVDEFARCIAGGGLAVFPADTVYGLGCNPQNRLAVARIYLLKRRPRDKAVAVMFFNLDAAVEALPELGARTREALELQGQSYRSGPRTNVRDAGSPGKRQGHIDQQLGLGAGDQDAGIYTQADSPKPLVAEDEGDRLAAFPAGQEPFVLSEPHLLETFLRLEHQPCARSMPQHRCQQQLRV